MSGSLRSTNWFEDTKKQGDSIIEDYHKKQEASD